MVNNEKLKGYMLEICKDTDEEDSGDFVYSWYKNGIGVVLKEKEAKILDNTIEEICSDEYIKMNFPKSFIKKELENIISEVLQESKEKRPDLIEKEFENLKVTLKKEIKNLTFLIPISNLKIENTFSIGNIKLIKFEEIKDEISAIYNPKGDEKFQKDIETRYERFSKNTFARVSVRGVPKFAQTKAFYLVRLAINILKLYAHPKDPNFGLTGESLTPEYRTIFSFSEDQKAESIYTEWVGLPLEYELNDEKIQIMERFHFNDLSEILKKNRLNDLETRILTSVYWFAEALNVQIIEDDSIIYEKKKKRHQNLEYFKLGERVIKLFTALEAILIFDENEPITENISERTAMLLGNDYETRKSIKKDLKELYGKRSKIMHHGDIFVSQSDLIKLTNTVRYIIFTLIKIRADNEFKSVNDLRKHIDKLKYS